MKYLLLFIFVLYSQIANAEKCDENKFTPEQWAILYSAYEVGSKDDLGYTLAAIIQQESFVGHRVIRLSPQDGVRGSYGVSHMQITTAMELLGVTNHWEAMADLAPYLIRDDAFAIQLAYVYLHKLHKLFKGNWQKTIRGYNGGPGGVDNEATLAYYNSVRSKVKYLQKCLEV